MTTPTPLVRAGALITAGVIEADVARVQLQSAVQVAEAAGLLDLQTLARRYATELQLLVDRMGREMLAALTPADHPFQAKDASPYCGACRRDESSHQRAA